jgi:hypothetical protein
LEIHGSRRFWFLFYRVPLFFFFSLSLFLSLGFFFGEKKKGGKRGAGCERVRVDLNLKKKKIERETEGSLLNLCTLYFYGCLNNGLSGYNFFVVNPFFTPLFIFSLLVLP